MIGRNLLGFMAILTLLNISSIAKSADESSAIAPKAAQALQQMSDYLGSLEQFSFRTENTSDQVMPSGQKLQFGENTDIAIYRPNRFRVNRDGDLAEQEFYFDGNTFTLYGKFVNYYATLKMSETVDIDTALDFAKEEIGVIAPTSDLFYNDSHVGLMEDVTSAEVVGTSMVGGIECQHLAFRGQEVDWQIWIEKSETPLPRKFLITSKWITGSPQFTAVFTDWNTSAILEDSLFEFSAPPQAEEIGFINVASDFNLDNTGN